MAGAKFQYDESGGTFFYFLFSFEALVVIPCTYYFWPRDGRREEERKDKRQCHCEHCSLKNSRLRAKEPLRKAKQRLIKFLLLTGWVCLFATGYKVVHLQHDYVAWDPFEILQIDPASSMSEIKKAYRRLSLIYHPDKETGDEKKFMMIAKAYAALTDEEARKNWETYGNPDGPGATSFGIALPSWIVEKENSVWVLGLYALVFMVALPVAVGIWWYRSVKFGGDQVLLDTTQLYYYFIHKTPYMILKRVLMVLAASMEFERSHNSEIIERPSDNFEVPQLIKELPFLGEKNRERPLCYGYSIKARALLHAHLGRMKLPPNTLDIDRMYVVKKCPYLLQEFVQCASQLTMLALAGRIARMPNLDTLESAMKLCSMIVQALWDNKSPLLQLPHVTEDMLRHFTTRRRNIRNIRQLACMKNDERRALLRSLSDDQYEDVMNVLSKIPIIEIDVRSEVLDDEESCNITAGAIVTVTVTLLRRPMSTLFNQDHTNEPEVEEPAEDNESQQQTTADQSPHIRKPKVWEKQKKKKGGRGKNKRRPPLKTTANSTVNKKVVQQQQQQQQHAIETKPQNKHPEEKTKTVADSEDSGESDSESDGASSHSGSTGDHDDASEDKGSGNRDRQVRLHEEDDDEWEKFQQKMAKKEKVLETKSKKSHSVHCPFFPEDKQEYWWVYIADKKRHSLITAPYLMTNLVEKEEVELKFTAPSKPGIYPYSVIVRSDSYLDLDVMKIIKMDVKEAKEVDLTDVQWDISEEEEDKEQEESAVEDSDLATDDDDLDEDE
uniref:Translocation protein SEC63 n=1 Tax=Hadrurus spadix TaxID=141984 RepID=A0A1W7R9M8_9SCOR